MDNYNILNNIIKKKLLLLAILSISIFNFSCSHKPELITNKEVVNLGIGNYLFAEVDNTHNYDWYIDQGTTGIWAYSNCGPTVTSMVIKWNDIDLEKKPESFRRKNEWGDWWTTKQVRDTLTKYGITCSKVEFKNDQKKTIEKELDSGNLIIFCLDISYVDYNESQYHYGRFYKAGKGSGHFIIAKGYKQTDIGLWLEVYDPYSFDKKYDNGILKGKNRYYHIKDIIEASDNWWKYYIKVSNTRML